LEEKKCLIAEILKIPLQSFVPMNDVKSQIIHTNKDDAREILLAALDQGFDTT